MKKQIKLLIQQKNKNLILEEKINKIQIEYEEKMISFQKSDEHINSKDSLVRTILEKDHEVNELKKEIIKISF